MSSFALSLLPAGNGLHRAARRACWQFFLAAAVFAALGRTSSAELPKYLPDGCNLILSIHFEEVYDSPYYQKLKTDIADFAAGERSFQEEVGLAPSNLAWVTVAGNMIAHGRDSEPVVIIRPRTPVSAADFKAAHKVHSYQKDFSYNEITVGEYTIYESTYRYSFSADKGELQHGDAFAVLADNTILLGANGEALRKVLARGKAAELSAELQNAVNGADFTKTMAWAMDLKAVTGDETVMKSFQRNIGPIVGEAANDELLKKLDAASFDAVLKGTSAQLRGSVAAKDADTAADVRKVVEAAQVLLRGRLEKLPRVPKDIIEAIGAVKFTVDGATVAATGEVKADAAVQWITDEYNYQKKAEEERMKERQQKRPAPPKEYAPAPAPAPAPEK